MKTADECRKMGLKIGETIQGRKMASGGWWSDTRLTLLFLGESVAVFRELSRNNINPEWVDRGESANWSLNYRSWGKVEN